MSEATAPLARNSMLYFNSKSDSIVGATAWFGATPILTTTNYTIESVGGYSKWMIGYKHFGSGGGAASCSC